MRQRRFERDAERPYRLTVIDGELLRLMAPSKYLTTHHLADITGWTEKKVRNHARKLFNAGLVTVLPVDSVLFHDSPYGTAPNVYAITQRGASWLLGNGLLPELPRVPEASRQSYVFLRHELLVSDVRAWVYRNAESVEVWREGPDAWMEVVKPDAWFVAPVLYGEKEARLKGIVEADRGTEVEAVWQKKVSEYERLYSDTTLLTRWTGSASPGRLLVVTLTAERRDRIASWLAGSRISSKIWLSAQEALSGQFTEGVWRRPGQATLQPMVG